MGLRRWLGFVAVEGEGATPKSGDFGVRGGRGGFGSLACVRIARAGDAGPGSLEREEEKRRGTPFDQDDTIPARNVLDGSPTPAMQQSDDVLRDF
jgi:hypothetical protein